MPCYALDTDVLSALKVERAELIALGRLPVLLTLSVWEEFLDPRGRQPELQFDKNMLVSMAGTPIDLVAESREASAFAKLYASTPSIGMGESSIIAVAVHNPDVVPVLLDQRALFRAVEELRGRVLSFHGFVDILQQNHGLAPKIAGRLSAAFLKKRSLSAPPLWWKVAP